MSGLSLVYPGVQMLLLVTRLKVVTYYGWLDLRRRIITDDIIMISPGCIPNTTT